MRMTRGPGGGRDLRRLRQQPVAVQARETDVEGIGQAALRVAVQPHAANSMLQALVELKKNDVPIDEQLLREMVDRLRAGLQKYDEAESALWKQWGEAGKN